MKSLDDRIKDRIERGYENAKLAAGPTREPTYEECWAATSHTAGDTELFDKFMKSKGVKKQAEIAAEAGGKTAKGAGEKGAWTSNVDPNK